MDVDTVLQSVQERDKWRRRLEVLQESLALVRTERRKLQSRLRRLRTEMRRLGQFSEAILEHAQGHDLGERSHATANTRLPAR